MCSAYGVLSAVKINVKIEKKKPLEKPGELAPQLSLVLLPILSPDGVLVACQCRHLGLSYQVVLGT